MGLDGQAKWKTDQRPPFARGGSILADGLLLVTDANTKLYLVEPSPEGFKPLASAVILSRAQLGAAGAGGRQASGPRTEGAQGVTGRAVSAADRDPPPPTAGGRRRALTSDPNPPAGRESPRIGAFTPCCNLLSWRFTDMHRSLTPHSRSLSALF